MMNGNERKPGRCNRVPDVGEIRAFLDQEGEQSWQRDFATHVEGCETCMHALQDVRMTSTMVTRRLTALHYRDEHAHPLVPPLAMDVLARKASTLLIDWARFGASPRTWAIRLGVIATAVVCVAATPAIGTFAQGTLQSFRVQKVQPVTVDLQAIATRLQSFNVDEAAVRQAVRYRGPEHPTLTLTTMSDAQLRAQMQLRAPTILPKAVGSGAPRVGVSEVLHAEITVDGPKLVQVARSAKVEDAPLIARLRELDGVAATIDAPAGVVMVWGNVAIPTTAPDPKTARVPTLAADDQPVLVFVQAPSPSVQVPTNVDLDGLRDAAVKSGVIPVELIQPLLAIRDWRTTLPIPAGTQGASNIRSIEIEGVSATLVANSNGKLTTLVWVRDGTVFLMSGNLGETDIIAAARSIKPVRL